MLLLEESVRGEGSEAEERMEIRGEDFGGKELWSCYAVCYIESGLWVFER